LKNYETIVRETYSPLIKQYNLEFAAMDNDEFFLIGHGFALWVTVDPRDEAKTWYVSIDKNGELKTYTMMYISKERFTAEDRALYGNPTSFDERVTAIFKIKCSGFMNHCQDILSGDKTWLQGYQDDGDYSRHVTKFLAPYFRKQGYPVKIRE